MPLPRGLPVVDHHCHLSPSGEGVGAARRFRAAGGTHLFLATQNYDADVPRSVSDYLRQFETTERLGRQIREETGVVVSNVVAPYPIDLERLVPAVGTAAALQVHCAALDLAGAWVREGRAVALGEVGRAHFPLPPEVAETIDAAFHHALEVAREVGCPLVVHSSDLDAAGFRELAERAREVGVPPEHIVKHYARSRVPALEREGVVPSYLARRELVRAVRDDPAPWFLETDFLDDRTRPGAVLDLATVPRRALAIAEEGGGNTDRLFVPFVESVEKVYGWRPEVPDGGSR
ncbi:MAG: TatD family hydrolase [Thermoplasmata archaeon]